MDQGSRQCVVVIDDLPENRLLAELYLGEHFHVIGRASGTESLAHLGEDAPDAVLLDLSLEEEDGRLVLGLLRDRLHDCVPILAFTASSHLDAATRELFDGVVPKPLSSRQELVTRITSVLTEVSCRAEDPVDGRRLVLVVEDDPLVRELQGRVVEEAGRVPILAGSLEEARRVLASQSGQVVMVMLDMYLPDGQGLELCRELVGGRWPEAAGVPVMVVSAEGDPTRIADGFFAGSVRHFHKPFQPLDLLRGIQEILDAV